MDHTNEPYEWVRWLDASGTQLLLMTLMQGIEGGTSLEVLQTMVTGWRANAMRALTAENWTASVDHHLEVQADCRPYLFARPAVNQHYYEAWQAQEKADHTQRRRDADDSSESEGEDG
jgi:hypothetical protein